MKNARPRFALLEDGRLHDYGTDRTIEADGTLDTPEGTWDLEKVRILIQDEECIEGAFTPAALGDKEAELNRTKKKLKWAQGELDKVNQANADFAKNTPPAATDDKVEKANADFQGPGTPGTGSNGQ